MISPITPRMIPITKYPLNSMISDIPPPNISVPIMPTEIDTARPFLVTLRSSLRSFSSVDSSCGIYFLRIYSASFASSAEYL